MPRYRTIACDHCGHMLLKRNEYCEVCGSMTRRERNLWIAKTVQIAVVLVTFTFIYFKIKGLNTP